MQKESIWEQYMLPKENKQLDGDIRTDVLIIGAGIAGILCALKLKESGVACVVVEKGNVLEGVTRNTTAKLTAQHGLIYDKIRNTYGQERAGQYYEINSLAMEKYIKLAERIPCDLEKKTAYVYSTNNKEKLEKEMKTYERLGIPYIWQGSVPLPIKTCGALGMKGQAQFNQIKLLSELVKQLDVYENAMVTKIIGKTVTVCKKNNQVKNSATHKYSIVADKIILATHFPMVNIPGWYFAKMYQHRSYVLAVNNGPQINGIYVDEDKSGYSFRNYKDYLLVGGDSHKTGAEGGGYLELQKFVSEKYPNKNIDFEWATQDCMSLDGIPYIGCHSKSHSNVYVATGFNKWGMTGAMSSAIVLQDLITKGKSEFEDLFAPGRSIWHKQLLINLGSAVGNLIKPGRKCTHMGCTLKWNPQERSWDCPCHGSRYGEDGTVLENPAKRNKSIK